MTVEEFDKEFSDGEMVATVDWVDDPALTFDEVVAQAEALPPVHAYTATACQHDRHGDCRYFCKWCPAPCDCPCHAETSEPYPGYSASEEAQLRQELRVKFQERGVVAGPRDVELLVDIATSVLFHMEKEQGKPGG